MTKTELKESDKNLKLSQKELTETKTKLEDGDEEHVLVRTMYEKIIENLKEDIRLKE